MGTALIYLIVHLLNKTYIIISNDEIRKVNKKTDELLLKTNQILYTKYLNEFNILDLMNPISELGCMEITSKKEDSSTGKLRIYCSKKIYNRLIANRYLPKY